MGQEPDGITNNGGEPEPTVDPLKLIRDELWEKTTVPEKFQILLLFDGVPLWEVDQSQADQIEHLALKAAEIAGKSDVGEPSRWRAVLADIPDQLKKVILDVPRLYGRYHLFRELAEVLSRLPL